MVDTVVNCNMLLYIDVHIPMHDMYIHVNKRIVKLRLMPVSELKGAPKNTSTILFPFIYR